jgi:hypothetical protein
MARIIPSDPNRDTADSPLGKFRRFAQLKTLAKDLTSQAEILKKELSSWVDQAGYADENGSKWVDFDSPIEGYASVQWQRRSTPKLDQDAAEKLLAEKGLLHRCTTTVTVLDETEIMTCLAEEVLTAADIAVMFPSTESWAFVPTKAAK